MEAKLIVATGKSAGRAIVLKRPRLLIGRAEECDIRPLSEEVSRRHCQVLKESDHVAVEDLGSRNGTFVNGKLIEAKTLLHDGDRLRVGSLELTVACVMPSLLGASVGSWQTTRRVRPSIRRTRSAWLMHPRKRGAPLRPSASGRKHRMRLPQGAIQQAAAVLIPRWPVAVPSLTPSRNRERNPGPYPLVQKTTPIRRVMPRLRPCESSSTTADHRESNVGGFPRQ